MALSNLFGEVTNDNTVQRLIIALEAMANNMSRMYPDTSGNTRVAVQNGTLSGLNAIGGYNAQYDQYSAIQSNYSAIRDRIITS